MLHERFDKESPEFGKPIPWVRIHKLPDYAYFDHSAHLAAGVSCVSCHGKVNEMTIVSQEKPLSMRWCIECHENPYEHIRPEEVSKTDLDWKWETRYNLSCYGSNHLKFGGGGVYCF